MSSSSDDNQDTRVVAVVLIAVILLAVGLAVGMGIHKSRSGSASSASGMDVAVGSSDAAGNMGHGSDAGGAVVASSAGGENGREAPESAQGSSESEQGSGSVEAAANADGEAAMSEVDKVAAEDDASVVVEDGVVQFYFASGKADLAAGASAVLAEAVTAAKAGKTLVISGFHDPTGNKAFNEQLAKKRAMAVRDALMADGVPEANIELRKPEETTGSGNNAEARRVEVMIAE